MANLLSRRRWLRGAAAVAACSVSGMGRRATAAPKADVLETKVISQRPNYYHGWPTLARRRGGQLLLVCSGGREAHVCPFGHVELMRSDDDGGRPRRRG